MRATVAASPCEVNFASATADCALAPEFVLTRWTDSPYWSLARREYPGIEGVPPSNEGKMPSIPTLPARSSPPVPTLEEPWGLSQGTRRYGIERERMDCYGVRSQARTAQAQAEERYETEVVPISATKMLVN